MTATRKVDHRNPPTAVDLLIEVYGEDYPSGPLGMDGLVFIKRKNEPFKGCWALPGGFQEVGESLEETALREGREETNLRLEIIDQLKVYSDPNRDPRGHVNSAGYVLRAYGIPKGGDDAAEARVFPFSEIPKELAFDHAKRVEEYKLWRYRYEKEHGPRYP